MARSYKKATSARLITIAGGIAAFLAATGIPLYLFFFDTHAPEIKDLLCDNQKENAIATRARPVFSWTFQDQDRGSSLVDIERAFLTLMENAYKQLEQQLDTYHQSG